MSAVADAIRTMKVRGLPRSGSPRRWVWRLPPGGPDATEPKELSRTRSEPRETTQKHPANGSQFVLGDRPGCSTPPGRALEMGCGVDEMRQSIVDFAAAMVSEDEAVCRAIGAHGARLLPKWERAHPLQCGRSRLRSYGTALGVIRAAVASGKKIHVYAERPGLAFRE